MLGKLFTGASERMMVGTMTIGMIMVMMQWDVLRFIWLTCTYIYY